jgi:hypothetical protein
MTTKTEVKHLPLRYGAQPSRIREVAAWVCHHEKGDSQGGKWLFHSRGSAQEAYRAVSYQRVGFTGGLITFDPEDVYFVLDQPVWGYDGPENDRPSLCWSGPHLTVAEFKAWYNEANSG